MQELVAQFLAHDGYVDTARAFAQEVATETLALQNGRNEPLKKYEVEEDREAINRNSKPIPLHSSAKPSLTAHRNPLRNPRWRHRQGPQAHQSLLFQRPRRPPANPLQTALPQIPRNDATLQRALRSNRREAPGLDILQLARARRLRSGDGARRRGWR